MGAVVWDGGDGVMLWSSGNVLWGVWDLGVVVRVWCMTWWCGSGCGGMSAGLVVVEV